MHRARLLTREALLGRAPFIDTSTPTIPQLVMYGVVLIAFDILQMSLLTLVDATISSKFDEPKFALIISSGAGLNALITPTLVLARAAS